jgi:uncharacterized protein YpmS
LKFISNFLIAIGVIAIFLVIFALIGYALFSFTPELKSQMGIGKMSADNVKSFDTKVDTFRKDAQSAAATGQKKDLTLTVTEDEINSKILDLAAQDKLPCKDMVINLKDNVLWVYCVFNTPMSNAKVGMVLRPEVIKNDIKVTVMDFQLGKLPLPKSVNANVADGVNIFLKMQSPTNDLPAEIKSVVIINKQLILTATTRAGS